MIILGLDTKVNKRVIMDSAMMSFMLMKQYYNESNNAYLLRFKSMVQTLKLSGGKHILVSRGMLGTNVLDASKDKSESKREKLLAMFFILWSHKTT